MKSSNLEAEGSVQILVEEFDLFKQADIDHSAQVRG